MDRFVGCFRNSPQELSLEVASNLIREAIENQDTSNKLVLQDIILSDNPIQVIQRLYSIGFVGLYNQSSSSYVFCHDGKDPDRSFSSDSKLLIHPCYLLALNSHSIELKITEAEDIHDEYDIEVSSIDKEFRKQKIGALMSELNRIPEGSNDHHEYTTWVKKSIMVLLATELVDIESSSRHEFSTITATNVANNPTWKSLLDDYQCKNVMFDIYNKQELGREEYAILSNKLSSSGEKVGFIVNRDKDNNLSKHRELKWVKEHYQKNGTIIIKISSKFLERQLSKSRNPQKHDDINKELSKLINQYHNMWLGSRKR